MRLAPWVMLLLNLEGCASCGPPPDVDGGVTWSTAFDTASSGWLLNAWGTSSSDVWAIGGTTDAGTLTHFDGDTWQARALPDGVPLLNWGFGFGPADVFFVGNEGTVLHFDGAGFTKLDTPTGQPLWGVWGAAPDDVWAVGGDGLPSHATLLHYDGHAWAQVTLPPMQKANVGQLLKVWGTGADNVYVVGQRGEVLHYSQGAWAEELVGASDDLISLWGTDAAHVIAVGGRSNGLISVWNGVSWTTTQLAPLPGLNGVWTRDTDVVHVVGVEKTVGLLRLSTLAFEAEQAPGSGDLHSTFGVGDTLFAVGGNLGSASPAQFKGLALTRTLRDGE